MSTGNAVASIKKTVRTVKRQHPAEFTDVVRKEKPDATFR
jgi:hypothetical protein